MKTIKAAILLLLAALAIGAPQALADSRGERQARRYIAEGNKQFNQKRYAEAEVLYNKAAQADSTNAVARFNLASAYLRQALPGDTGNELRAKASSIYQSLLRAEDNTAQRAAYNLGNMAYNDQKYDQAIAMYKEALRRNPDDDQARDNLRLAQLKKQQQDQNKDNQDQNKDQNKDNQDQNQDQNKNQQDQKDQNQDQQDQNQDQNDQQQQQQQRQSSLSAENAEKILKAMENEEAATRRRVQEAEKKEQERQGRRVVSKPW